MHKPIIYLCVHFTPSLSSSSSRTPVLTHSGTLSSHTHAYSASWFSPSTLLTHLPPPPIYEAVHGWIGVCAHISPAPDSSLLLHKSHAKAYKSDYNSHRPTHSKKMEVSEAAWPTSRLMLAWDWTEVTAVLSVFVQSVCTWTQVFTCLKLI